MLAYSNPSRSPNDVICCFHLISSPFVLISFPLMFLSFCFHSLSCCINIVSLCIGHISLSFLLSFGYGFGGPCKLPCQAVRFFTCTSSFYFFSSYHCLGQQRIGSGEVQAKLNCHARVYDIDIVPLAPTQCEATPSK